MVSNRSRKENTEVRRLLSVRLSLRNQEAQQVVEFIILELYCAQSPIISGLWLLLDLFDLILECKYPGEISWRYVQTLKESAGYITLY